MKLIESEAAWLVNLPQKDKLLFLATLSHTLTIVGRNCYEAGTEELETPKQLRKINEIQHRVVACIRKLLKEQSKEAFESSIANWVLLQGDPELDGFLGWVWFSSKVNFHN